MILEFCADTLNIWVIVGKVFQIIKWIIPIILLILGIIDLVKCTVAGDEKAIKQAQGMLIKRIIYGLIIFLLPTLIVAVMSLVTSEGTGNRCWTCVSDYDNIKCQYTIVNNMIVPKFDYDDDSKNSDSSDITIQISGKDEKIYEYELTRAIMQSFVNKDSSYTKEELNAMSVLVRSYVLQVEEYSISAIPIEHLQYSNIDFYNTNSNVKDATINTEGEYIVNERNVKKNIKYTDEVRKQIKAKLDEGKNYKQALEELYNVKVTSKDSSDKTSYDDSKDQGQNNNVSGEGKHYVTTTLPNKNSDKITGDWTLWKQGNEQWKQKKAPGSSGNMWTYGCAITSVSIMVAQSGVETKEVEYQENGVTKTLTELNPGTMMYTISLTKNADIIWKSATDKFAPNLNFVSEQTNLENKSKKEIISLIKEKLKPNRYIILGVKSTGHFVVLNYVDETNQKIYVHDPGSKAGIGILNLYDSYKKVYSIRTYERVA